MIYILNRRMKLFHDNANVYREIRTQTGGTGRGWDVG
jgi:hypothetical protein